MVNTIDGMLLRLYKHVDRCGECSALSEWAVTGSVLVRVERGHCDQALRMSQRLWDAVGRYRQERVSMIAALYVETNGVYFNRIGVDPWDITRDAKRYMGPHPVVAHPPCGPWGRLKFLNKHQDASCGPRAVDQVRSYGGVLEHPEHSSLWTYCGLAMPGEMPDVFGGFTIHVNQVWFGHKCKKSTWLYCVGVPIDAVRADVDRGLKPTHRITNGSRGDTSLPRVNAQEAAATPPAFADYLIGLAEAV